VGKEAGGTEESPACPPVLDCPQTRLTLISRNKASRFLALTFMRRNYRDRPRSMQLILPSIFKIRIDRVGDKKGRIPEVWDVDISHPQLGDYFLAPKEAKPYILIRPG
jgi:hypothetical protein